jgi:FkbM family methyltransferase
MRLGGFEVRQNEVKHSYVRLDHRGESTTDRMIHSARSYGGHVRIHPGDIVLDLGANVGSFTRWAVREGAARVVAVEADPETFVLLVLNAETYCQKVDLINAAVLGLNHQHSVTTFYVSPENRIASSAVVFSRNTRRVVVPVVRFHDLLDLYQFTVLKIDVEGAEHGLSFSCIPHSVHTIAIDYHVFGRSDWMESVHRIHRQITEQGFEITKPMKDRIAHTTEYVYLKVS